MTCVWKVGGTGVELYGGERVFIAGLPPIRLSAPITQIRDLEAFVTSEIQRFHSASLENAVREFLAVLKLHSAASPCCTEIINKIEQDLAELERINTSTRRDG